MANLYPLNKIDGSSDTNGFSHDTIVSDNHSLLSSMTAGASYGHGRHYSDACPDVTDSSSTKSSSEEEEDDAFDMEGLPMPRISSSTLPIVVEVAPRTGSFASKDPLFRGVCLYSGSMTSTQRYEAEFKSKEEQEKYSMAKASWLSPSMFSRLFTSR